MMVRMVEMTRQVDGRVDVTVSEGDGPCKDVDGDDVNVTGCQ